MSNFARSLFNDCSNFAQSRLPALLPAACELCGAASGKRAVCAACAAGLPTLPAACPICALPQPAGAVCGTCLAHPPPFAATLAPWVYAEPVDLLIQAFKFQGRLALAGFLAEGLHHAITTSAQALPELLLPLPLAPGRQRERGYNQAQELARQLARRLQLPLAERAVIRVGVGVPQSSLPWKERARNIRHAFRVQGEVAGRHVAVVDDVMTTGATLTEMAKVLREAGAARVSNWVLARTLPPVQ